MCKSPVYAEPYKLVKEYNKRKVQYMAGHRYISSTEAYEANNIEVLQEDVERFYAILESQT